MDNSLLGQYENNHQVDNDFVNTAYNADLERYGKAWVEDRAEPQNKGSLIDTMFKLDYND